MKKTKFELVVVACKLYIAEQQKILKDALEHQDWQLVANKSAYIAGLNMALAIFQSAFGKWC